MKTIHHQNPPSKKLNVTQSVVSKPVDVNNISNSSFTNYNSANMAVENDNKIPPEFYDISNTLVSKFAFYNFDSLHIRKFSVEDIFQIVYAQKFGSFRPIAQALQNCIYENIDVLSLTKSDAIQLLYWQKLNSYFKTEFSFDFICENQAHIDKIANNEVGVETLINKSVTKFSDLVTEELDDQKAFNAFNLLKDLYKLEFVPESFGSFIELEELKQDFINKVEHEEATLEDISPEDQTTLYIAEFAKHLSPIHGHTLKDKIEFFRLVKLPPTILQDIIDYKEVIRHTIKEQVKSTCKECGGETVSILTIDPRSFFPEL